ncbi:MAG: PorT family protein, partial [Cyclobacteriaceae bacterium]|nr:PorT family protein [Cyclobacteriaceae bacterium]
MSKISKLFFIFVFLCFSTTSKAQILISLLLGDALNTEKIEFGINTGLNRSYILDIEESSGLNNFNIGFYFHINMF